MRQYHITTFSTCSHLVLLYLELFLRFMSLPRQLEIQVLKLAFPIRFSFICIFYGSIHIWLYTCTIDQGSDIKKNPRPRPGSSKIFRSVIGT